LLRIFLFLLIYFQHLLDEYWVARKINVKTRWKEFKQNIKNDPRFLNLQEDDVEGSTPAELFYDLIEDLEERYHKEKKRVKQILKEVQVNVNAQVSYETFVEAINKHENYQLLDESNLKFIYSDLQDKAVRVEEKTKKKSKKKFLSTLKTLKITKGSTWDQVKGSLPAENITFSEKEQKDLFEEHLKKRAMEDDFDSTSDEEEGAIHERRRSHKKERRHSRSSNSKKKRDSDRRRESDDSEEDKNDDDSNRKKRRYV